MPRSLLKFSLLLVAVSVVFACGGPPKKPTPPDKTTGMTVAKGTKTEDMPVAKGEPEAPARPLTIDEYVERMMRGRQPAMPPAKPVPMKPVPAKPAPVKPVPAKPAPVKPVPMKPVPMKPVPAKPIPAKPAPMKPVPAKPAPVKPAPAKPAPMKPAPMKPAPVKPKVETLAEKRLRELEEKKKLELQYQDYLVKYYMGQADRLKKELRFAEAEEWVLRALKIAPDNQEAIALLHEVRAAQGKRGGELVNAADELDRLHRVKIEEAQAKANYYFNEGRKAMHERRYDAAIDSFEDTLMVINNAPYGADWGTLKEDTDRYLFEAKQQKEQADEDAARTAAKKALEKVKEDELKRKAEAEERIATLLAQGLQEFENERFQVAENLADQVLALDPMNARAKELERESVRARHAQTNDDLLRTQKERFREWRLDIQESIIPWSSRPLQWPDQRSWDKVNRRARAITDFGAGTELAPEDQALKNLLHEEKTQFTFEGTPLVPDALDFLRTLHGISIVVDEEIKSDLEGATIDLSVTNLELDSALELLLTLAGADYTYVLRNGVVYITNKEGARGDAVLRVHTVGDLTIRLTNFVAPNLILKPAGAEIDESQPLFGKSEEGEQLLGGGAEELMDLITQNIDPEGWEGDEYSINVSGEDKLVVVHTPEVQAEVARFLDDLRKFAGLVVTIESRFLTVNDDFLQDVGIDLRGLGGEKGPLVNLDDVTSGLEDNASAGFDNGNPGLPVASASNPSSGVFFNQGGDGDYRGRTENLFDRALGRVLSPLGGAVIQYTFLDDTSIGLIMKAVEKSRHARFLQAPSLTVYNTQRANITLVNQLSFIQDFDVEVAQTAFIADPIVGIIQDGLALDVRPTISHDRKYVTLELQPTIATLIRPIPTFQTSLGALTTPVTIQLPELIIQKSQTTVRVPDGGSLVIGGLKNISLVDMQSEVPFIAKIPILNFFFSRKGSSREVENLMVIVTARITDLTEEEMRFRMPYAK